MRGSKLQKELAPQVLKDRRVISEFAKVSTTLFIKEKQRMLRAFDSHPVTRELRGGANSPNLSGTLPNKGNLFGFIGFPSGADVISTLRSALENINIKPKFSRGNPKGGEKIFLVTIPSAAELYGLTPLPWASGRSWLQGVEHGMSGLGQYMYTTNSSVSRSGAGIQTDISAGGSLTGVTYLTNGGILADFEMNLTKISSGQRGFGITTT